MSLKYSNTTADYLPWNEMVLLVRRLFEDGNFTYSLLISLGSFWGLRISDLRDLKWEDILYKKDISITEQKTGKKRNITISPQLQRHIKACFDGIQPFSTESYCFISQMGTVLTIQRINSVFKELKKKYNLPISNFSTHSMRKTFGRQIISIAGEHSEMALIKLGEIFGHSSTQITRRYLGLRQQEIAEVYESLSF